MCNVITKCVYFFFVLFKLITGEQKTDLKIQSKLHKKGLASPDRNKAIIAHDIACNQACVAQYKNGNKSNHTLNIQYIFLNFKRIYNDRRHNVSSFYF